MAQTVRITVDGSEDSTELTLELEHSQLQFVLHLAKKLNEAKSSNLSPNISVAVEREVKNPTYVWDKLVGDDVK